MVGAFMIVDSFGHYSAQTVHDHGPPTARHKYPVALCLSMYNMHKGNARYSADPDVGWASDQAMQYRLRRAASCRRYRRCSRVRTWPLVERPDLILCTASGEPNPGANT
jgi:hypothetical protein